MTGTVFSEHQQYIIQCTKLALKMKFIDFIFINNLQLTKNSLIFGPAMNYTKDQKNTWPLFKMEVAGQIKGIKLVHILMQVHMICVCARTGRKLSSIPIEVHT